MHFLVKKYLSHEDLDDRDEIKKKKNNFSENMLVWVPEYPVAVMG